MIYGWSSGEPARIGDAEAERRGIRSETVVGPPMLERVGGDIRVLEKRAMAEAAAGRWKPAVTRFPLAEAAAAHRALENRETTGKVVLEP